MRQKARLIDFLPQNQTLLILLSIILQIRNFLVTNLTFLAAIFVQNVLKFILKSLILILKDIKLFKKFEVLVIYFRVDFSYSLLNLKFIQELIF